MFLPNLSQILEGQFNKAGIIKYNESSLRWLVTHLAHINNHLCEQWQQNEDQHDHQQMGSANRMSKSNYIAIDSCHNVITNANICCSSYFNQFFKIHAQEPSIVISLTSVCPS